MSQLAMVGVAVCLMAGTLLGLRFKVFVAVPASLLAIIAAIALDWAAGRLGLATVLSAILSAGALQVGYLVGAAVALKRAGRGRSPAWGARANESRARSVLQPNGEHAHHLSPMTMG